MSLLLYSTRSKLILGFLAVALVVCGVALAVGGRMLYQAFMHEASNRVRMDLNAAREIYDSRVRVVRSACALASTGPVLQSAIRGRDLEAVLARLGDVAAEAELDFMGVVAGEAGSSAGWGPIPSPPPGSARTRWPAWRWRRGRPWPAPWCSMQRPSSGRTPTWPGGRGWASSPGAPAGRKAG